MKKILFLILLGLTTNLYADSWLPPTIKKYFSKNGEYMLKVFPTDNYKNFNIKIPCHAILYKIHKNDTIKIWDKPLINRIAPVKVIVANDGSSIATFDNWGVLGHGNDVFVIYNKKGKLMRNYPLKEFSPCTLDNYQKSVSSIWWRCDANYSNTELIEICCNNKNGKQLIYYNVKQKKFQTAMPE